MGSSGAQTKNLSILCAHAERPAEVCNPSSAGTAEPNEVRFSRMTSKGTDRDRTGVNFPSYLLGHHCGSPSC